MPYYITDKSSECAAWAVVKEDGEVLGCHDTKESAIDQAVAASIATDEPFDGERAAVGSLRIGDWVSWNPLDPEIVAQVVMVGDQFAAVRIFEEDDAIFTPTDKIMVLNVFKLEKVPMPQMLAEEITEEIDPAERFAGYANTIVAKIGQEETNSMDKKNKWQDIARAIQARIDGVQPNKENEIRTNSVEFEIREEETADGMTFTGYASVFNSPSEDLGGFVEYVAPGAFKRSLQARNEIKLLWNHDTGEPLASVRGGSLKLEEDTRGLKVTAQLPNTTRGRDVAELLRSKVIDSMSFGFNVIKDTWSKDGQTRTLEAIRLHEVSIVSYPAYKATTAQVRSVDSAIDADQLAEALLKLESGETLEPEFADVINAVVSKLRQQPEVQEAEDNGLELLDLKKKQLDLLMKKL